MLLDIALENKTWWQMHLVEGQTIGKQLANP